LSGHGFKPWRTQTKTLFFWYFGFELNMKGWGENPRVGSREVAGKWL